MRGLQGGCGLAQQGCNSVGEREVAVAAAGTGDPLFLCRAVTRTGQAATQALQIHRKKQEMQFPEGMLHLM